MEEDQCNSNSPQEDIQIAERVLAEGDYPHAAFHVAAALSTNPLRRDWIELFNEIIERCPEPETLLPRDEGEDGDWFGSVAARAYAYYRTGDLGRAFASMGALIGAMPDTAYFPWLVEMLEDDSRIDRECDPDDLVSLASSLIQNQAIDQVDPEMRNEICDRLSEGLAILAEKHPEDEDLGFGRSLFLRRLGRLDEAESVAMSFFEHAPSWRTAIAVAMVHKERGDEDVSLEWYDRAADLEPENETTYLDVGDIHLDREHFREAAEAYNKACIIVDEHPWGYPSLLFARRMAGIDEQENEAALVAYAEVHPENDRARYLVEWVRMQGQERFVDFLPEPTEALINCAKQLLAEEVLDGGTIQVRLSHLEAPSAVLAVERTFRQISQTNDDPVLLDLEVTGIPQPDPRKSPWNAPFKLWKYRKSQASPGLKEPRREIVELVSSLAASPDYQLEAWWEKGGKAAAGLELSDTNDLVASMVHIPDPEVDLPFWNWILRVQMAAMFVLARLHEDEDLDSRKHPLRVICEGVIDWPVIAAAVALRRLVDTRPEVESLVGDIYHSLLKRRAREGACCFDLDVIRCYLSLPNLPEELKEPLQQDLDSLLAEEY